MTKSIVMYRDDRNNDTISFPSPADRNEQKTFGGLLLEITKSGSMSLICKSTGTYIVLDTDRGTKTFKMASSYKVYDEIKKAFPEHCPGYGTDIVDIGPIRVYINRSGISVVFNTEEEEDED